MVDHILPIEWNKQAFESRPEPKNYEISIENMEVSTFLFTNIVLS